MSIAQQNEINQLRARIEALESVIQQLLDSAAHASKPKVTSTLKLKQNGQAN